MINRDSLKTYYRDNATFVLTIVVLVIVAAGFYYARYNDKIPTAAEVEEMGLPQ